VLAGDGPSAGRDLPRLVDSVGEMQLAPRAVHRLSPRHLDALDAQAGIHIDDEEVPSHIVKALGNGSPTPETLRIHHIYSGPRRGGHLPSNPQEQELLIAPGKSLPAGAAIVANMAAQAGQVEQGIGDGARRCVTTVGGRSGEELQVDLGKHLSGFYV
jgi:hypothetical protein